MPRPTRWVKANWMETCVLDECAPSFKFFINLFLNNLYAQHGAWTHEWPRDQELHGLLTEPALSPSMCSSLKNNQMHCCMWFVKLWWWGPSHRKSCSKGDRWQESGRWEKQVGRVLCPLPSPLSPSLSLSLTHTPHASAHTSSRANILLSVFTMDFQVMFPLKSFSVKYKHALRMTAF